ncbi:MAG: deoxyribose-phosphate aldolase [Spirochaetia bacterium]
MSENLANYIDHTLLKVDAKYEDFFAAAQIAKKNQCASLCIPPTWVAAILPELAQTNVLMCTVIGFPMGYSKAAIKEYEASVALDDGAQELDMVMNISQFLSGNYLDIVQEIEPIANKCHTYKAKLKVIIETAYLNKEQKMKACQVISDAGANFIKTSTGFAPSGATIEDIQLISSVVGTSLGIKASGGIKDKQMALDLIAAGATRLGTSQTLAILCDETATDSAY